MKKIKKNSFFDSIPKKSNKSILRKCSSLPNLQVESIEHKLMKMRVVSSSENVSEIIPIVKHKAELESYRKKSMQERLAEAAPFNLFFNVMEVAPETYKQPNAIKFTDLLCPSLGKLKSSLHICNHVDIHWLMKQYKIRNLSDTHITIVTSDIDEEGTTNLYLNVKFQKIKKEGEHSGTHNSKISLFIYEDNSLRVTCGGANPSYFDWNGLNQAIWVSPKCPPLADHSDLSTGESDTNFKMTLLEYLEQYDFNILEPFIQFVKGADFKHIRIFLITSSPGICHDGQPPRSYTRLISTALSKYVQLPSENHQDWLTILNSPCIDFLTRRKKIFNERISYFLNHIRRPLNCHNLKPMNATNLAPQRVMFPSIRDVLENNIVGSRRMTILKNNRSQNWLGVKYAKMLRFRMNGYGRTGAALGASMYYRISPCSNYMAYFLLTSANLTKSSWGLVNNRYIGPNPSALPITVESYEAGILFIPQFFNEAYFCIRNSSMEEENCKLFPMLADPEMVGYNTEDEPWYFKK